MAIQQVLTTIDGQLKKWNGEIEGLKKRIQEAGADYKIKYASRLQEFVDREGQIRQMMEKANSAGEEAWPNLKARLEYARDGFQRRVTQLINLLEKDGI